MSELEALSLDSTAVAPSIFRVEVARNVYQTSPVTQTQLYFLEGSLSREQLLKICQELLADPVIETFSIAVIDRNGAFVETFSSPNPPNAPKHTIEVALLPGVTDPTAENLVRATQLLGITTLQRAAIGQRYLFYESSNRDALEHLAVESYSNLVIQRVAIDQPIAPPFIPFQQVDASVETIPLRNASDERLLQISAERRLALNLPEMQAIREYFRKEDRDASDLELEMLAQTWSEHCIHKTFRAIIDYIGPLPSAALESSPVLQTINGLLRTYIRGATEKVAQPWLYSAFVDNAGIVAFDDHWDLAFKVETHNHPSALEPFGGANTGVGGVVRDILGVSARPIANTDILCFGPQDIQPDQLVEGVLHPRRIAEGVVHGVEDYGNKMGIPTVNGAILYHPGYTANPLIFCGCLGLLPHGSHPTGAQPGDQIVVIGGRTGRDGLRGATFSSMEMDSTTSVVSGSAVQIGNPIHEKQVQEVVLRLRDARLYHAITDCGAGGLSSAVGEMAQGLGVRVNLEAVPLKYAGLRPWEIWLSEAQERMVLAVPPEVWPQVQAICAGQDLEPARIGVFEATDYVLLSYEGQTVGKIAIDFLHDGIPQHHLKAEWTPTRQSEAPIAHLYDLKQTLLGLLAHPNIRSKEDVIRRYDHEVQGGTALKPLVGVDNHGPADAAVLVPLDTRAEQSHRAVALSAGICPAYGEIDPYPMAWAAIDEAMRNLVAVGTDPDQVAILDNFCWGNPSAPDRLGSLVRCVQGCYDAALAYRVPFISGKDSLNNEYADTDGTRHAIPGTLLVSGMGIVPDVCKTVTLDLKVAGNSLFVLGSTRNELGGSHFNLLNSLSGGTAPQPVPNGLDRLRSLYQAICAGLVLSCHDCSEGGLSVALAEMCIAGRLGADIDLGNVATESEVVALFSESLCRFLVEVRPADERAFREAVHAFGNNCYLVGSVTTDGKLIVRWNGSISCQLPVAELEHAWRGQVLPTSIESAPSLPVIGKSRQRVFATRTSAPHALILHANGSNRDHDAALACELAGAVPEIVHVNQLSSGDRTLRDYQMLIVPGGFSYGDDLGAGRLWALDLQHRLAADLALFVAEGRPVLGICNGFQALVKAGVLPGPESTPNGTRMVTLTHNAAARFECRWVVLQPKPHSPCLFTEGLDEPIYCPVAHGEGQLVAADTETRDALWSAGLAPLTYVNADGTPADYPANPNGSVWGIAGLCNPQGNVLGLMPHPEDHVFPWQHPRWRRGEKGMDGLRLFKNGVKYA